MGALLCRVGPPWVMDKMEGLRLGSFLWLPEWMRLRTVVSRDAGGDVRPTCRDEKMRRCSVCLGPRDGERRAWRGYSRRERVGWWWHEEENERGPNTNKQRLMPSSLTLVLAAAVLTATALAYFAFRAPPTQIFVYPTVSPCPLLDISSSPPPRYRPIKATHL